MGVRRQGREAALQALFMCDFIGIWTPESVEFCFDHFGMSKGIRPFATQIAQGALKNIAQIDSKLTVASENWSLTRMGRVDRSILRLAAYEMLCQEDIPINVAINEAIEIAKRFGSEESPQFINGVLDRIASQVRTGRAAKGLVDAASTLAVEVETIAAAGQEDSDSLVGIDAVHNESKIKETV